MGSYNGKWVASYNGMLVRELKAELEGRKLSTVGVRTKLVKSLAGDDESGYNLLTVRELKIRMEEQGLDILGNKKVLKNRMKSALINRGYKFLPTNDLRQLCSEKGLVTTGHKSTLVTRLSNVVHLGRETYTKPELYTRPNNIVTPQVGNGGAPISAAPAVVPIVMALVGVFIVLGCIGIMEDIENDEDEYSSSSSSSSGGSSTPCEQLKDVWCYSYSLDMCVYHDSSNNIVYYQEANWYGC